MGVDRTDYLMYGVKIDPDLVDYDKHENLICGVPGAPFDLVYDGMSGKYAVAGKIIARSREYEGLEFHEITDESLPKDAPALAAAISETFATPVDRLRLYLFSHYS